MSEMDFFGQFVVGICVIALAGKFGEHNSEAGRKS